MRGLYVIHYNASGKGKRGKLSADQKRSALWSRYAAKFGKLAKCAVGAKCLKKHWSWLRNLKKRNIFASNGCF